MLIDVEFGICTTDYLTNERKKVRPVGYGCRNAFEDEAVTYDDTLYILPHYNEVIDDVLASIHFPKDVHIRVLDLGCGTGTLVKKIMERYPNAFVYAVDFSSAMLSVAQTKNCECENIHFSEEDIFKINEDKYPYFDLVVSTFVLHNYEGHALYEEIFKKVTNLLSVGGKFVLGDLIQCEGIEEQKHELSLQIEGMKKNHLSDEEITRWLNLLNDEDSPLPIWQIEKYFKQSGFTSIISKKIGSTAVFSAIRPLDVIHVKSELLIFGIIESDFISNIYNRQNPENVPKTGNNGVFLTLNNSLQVLVSFLHENNQISPYSVVEESGCFYLTKFDKRLDINITGNSFPDWYLVSVHTEEGEQKFSKFFVLEGDRYLHLAYKCCVFSDKDRCAFCSVEHRDTNSPDQADNSAEEICSVLEEMFSHNYIPPDFHFCLGGGTYLPLMNNVVFFSKIISCIRKYRSIEKGENPIWIEMIPPSKEEIQKLIDVGATSFGFNIEVFDGVLRQKYCPGKSNTASLEHYFEAFDMVNTKLGINKVGSCIIVGLDNQEILKSGIDTLISHKVFPCVLPLKFFDGAHLKLDDTALALLERDFIVLSRYAAVRVMAQGIDISQNEGCLHCPCCTIIHDMILSD